MNNIRELIEKYSYLIDISGDKNEIENFCYYYSLRYDDVIELFNELFNTYMENNEENVRIEEIFGTFMKAFSSGQYSELIVDILNNLNVYSNDDIMQINKVILNPNRYDIKSIKEVWRYDQIREEYCDKNVGLIDDDSNKKDILKEMILQKAYNQDYTSTIQFLEQYGNNLNELRNILVDTSVVDFLESIQMLVNMEDVEKLKRIYNECEIGSIDLLQVEGIIKQQYESMYSTLNYNITSETKSPTLIEETVEMYKAPPEFFMTVSSFGGIFNKNCNITNYKERWMSINSQTISTSFISNNNMSTVPIKDVCFGFCEFEANEKIMMGSRNQYAKGNYLNPQSKEINTCGKCCYEIPWDLIESTKKHIDVTVDQESMIPNFNEMVYRRTDKDGKIREPSYVVYFSKGKVDEQDPIWKNSIKAAKDFDIPIVVVDKTICLEKSFDKKNFENKLRSKQTKKENNIRNRLQSIAQGLKRVIQKQSKFSEQEIGKATINVETANKDKVQMQVQRDEKLLLKEQHSQQSID